MKWTRLTRLTVVVALPLAGAACGSKKSNPAGGTTQPPPAAPVAAPSAPAPSPAPTTTFDPQLAQEYGQLPPVVMIAATADASGAPVAGSAAVRYPPADAVVASPAQAFAAFDAPAGAAGGELDQDGSSQSWGASTWGYQSKERPGFVFSYGDVQRYQVGNRIIFVYSRPGCAPRYCQAGAPTEPVSIAVDPAAGNWDAVLQQAFARYGVRPLTPADFLPATQAQIDLGNRLFNDTVLSATGDMACASCHIDQRGTSNDYALAPINVVITGRVSGPLTPADVLGRNTPSLFNVGVASLGALFWDGRVARDPSQPSGFRTPAGAETPAGLVSALAAQSLFPLISPTEMGNGTLLNGVYYPSPSTQWAAVMQRVLVRSDYVALLQAAYPEANGVFGIQHVANAIAAFESYRWQALGSPWDRYVEGDRGALSEQQKRGAVWFYTKGNCAVCHSGPLLSDGSYHATATPQFGPGEGDGPSGLEDYGVGRVTGSPADRYKFKTPSLRNVEMNGPWGHDGAFTTLRDVVAHYIDPAASLDGWDPSRVIVPAGLPITPALVGAHNDPAARAAIMAANEARPVALSSGDVDDIMEFLLTLTDAGVAHNDFATVIRH